MFPWANTGNLLLQSLFTKPPFLHQSDQNVDNHGIQIFSNYPSPFIDEHELPLNQILPRGLLVAGAGDRSTSADQTMSNTSVSTKEKESKEKLALANGGDSKLKQKADDNPSRRRSRLAIVPRKRTGKKDRHSKICTAQGIRDRRMRLSLHVARKFFDLQDVLGYDKASKTIEWLFSKSKTAIEELILVGENTNFSITTEAKSESFASDNEEVSGIEETSNNEMRIAARDSKKTQKIACKNDVRESREKARARARCRTAEKMINKHQWIVSSPNQIDLQKLGCCSNSPFEGIEHQQLVDVGTIEKLLENVGSSDCCPNNNFSYYNLSTSASDSSFMGILENWSLLNNDRHLGGTDQDSVYSASTSNLPLFPS